LTPDDYELFTSPVSCGHFTLRNPRVIVSSKLSSAFVAAAGQDIRARKWIQVFTVLLVHKTRILADAQRDGRPAEYRWRPLQNVP